MTKQEFIKWAKARSWVVDKWGHLQKQVDDKRYRFRVSKISVRYELKMDRDFQSLEWLRLRSGYFKDLSITPDGKLSGLRIGSRFDKKEIV